MPGPPKYKPLVRTVIRKESEIAPTEGELADDFTKFVPILFNGAPPAPVEQGVALPILESRLAAIELTDEALEKAKTTVLKNLAKDANFYSSLLNQDQSPYKFKAPETDAPGMQAKADGYLKKETKKDEKANVKDNLGKKEEGTAKPKGVKVMPDKGVTGSEKTIKEGLEITKAPAPYDNQIEISDDGGEYSGFIEDNGTVSFSVYYDDMEDIENKFGPEGISEDNWKDVLGSNHAFVKIINNIGGDVEAAGDSVEITVNADKLLNSNLKEGDGVASNKVDDMIKSGKIKNSSILYYQEKGYATHATALDYLINDYNWNVSTQPSISVKEAEVEVKRNAPVEKTYTNKQAASMSAKEIYKQVDELDNPTDARSLALSYFAGGNKISPETLYNEVITRRDSRLVPTGAETKKEISARDYVEKNAKSIKEIAHSIWDNLSEELQSTMDTQDIRDELIDIVQSFNKRVDIAKEYLDKYSDDQRDAETEFYASKYGPSDVSPKDRQITVNQFNITVTPDGKMFYANGKELTDQTTKNKVNVRKELQDGTLRSSIYNNSNYFVLLDDRIVGSGKTNLGKESVTDPKIKEAILAKAITYKKTC